MEVTKWLKPSGNGARARLMRHRQTKGAETDRPIMPPPRHIPTLPFRDGACWVRVFLALPQGWLGALICSAC